MTLWHISFRITLVNTKYVPSSLDVLHHFSYSNHQLLQSSTMKLCVISLIGLVHASLSQLDNSVSQSIELSNGRLFAEVPTVFDQSNDQSLFQKQANSFMDAEKDELPYSYWQYIPAIKHGTHRYQFRPSKLPYRYWQYLSTVKNSITLWGFFKVCNEIGTAVYDYSNVPWRTSFKPGQENLVDQYISGGALDTHTSPGWISFNPLNKESGVRKGGELSFIDDAHNQTSWEKLVNVRADLYSGPGCRGTLLGTEIIQGFRCYVISRNQIGESIYLENYSDYQSVVVRVYPHHTCVRHGHDVELGPLSSECLTRLTYSVMQVLEAKKQKTVLPSPSSFS